MAKCSKCAKKGLFLKLTNGLCENCLDIIRAEEEKHNIALYERLCSSYKAYQDIPFSDEKNEAIMDIIHQLKTCPPHINDLILEASEKHQIYHYHKVFGCLFENTPLSELSQKLWKESWLLSSRLAKSREFSHEVETIPIHTISIAPAFSLRRHKLSDMPEIKYSPIGKAFSFDKMPSFVVIDTETTGIKVSGGAIIELSAVLYEDLTPVLAFTTLINPQKPIPADATKINGITDDMVKDAPTLAQVTPAFLDFISNKPLVGYNLPFDLKFLWANGVDFTKTNRKYYDVLDLCRKAYKKDLNSFSLEDVCALNSIYRLDAHRSLSDCVATAKVFEAAVSDLR